MTDDTPIPWGSEALAAAGAQVLATIRQRGHVTLTVLSAGHVVIRIRPHGGDATQLAQTTVTRDELAACPEALLRALLATARATIPTPAGRVIGQDAVAQLLAQMPRSLA